MAKEGAHLCLMPEPRAQDRAGQGGFWEGVEFDWLGLQWS